MLKQKNNMMILRFRSTEEHKDLLKKVKKMKEFTEDIMDCLEGCMEDEEYSFRDGYRKEMSEDEPDYRGRYGYRRGGMR